MHAFWKRAKAPVAGTELLVAGERFLKPPHLPTLTSSARTGRKMMIVAVLLANSVKKAMTTVMSSTARAGGTFSRGCSCPPIHADSPDSCRGRGASVHTPARPQPPSPGAGSRREVRMDHDDDNSDNHTPSQMGRLRLREGQ